MEINYKAMEGQRVFSIPKGHNVKEVIVKEKKSVGIDHISDTSSVDFLVNIFDGSLTATKTISKDAEVLIILS